jgi:hypothetical protein
MPRICLPLSGSRSRDRRLRRDVRLLAIAGRRYSPAPDAFNKSARLVYWQSETGPPKSGQNAQFGRDRSSLRKGLGLRGAAQAAE